jgi:hypothetical protein
MKNRRLKISCYCLFKTVFLLYCSFSSTVCTTGKKLDAPLLPVNR